MAERSAHTARFVDGSTLAAAWPGHCQGLAFFRKDQCEKLSWLCAAGIPGNLMRAAGRFVEHFPGFVHFLGLARYFRDHVSFEDVRQNETCMMMHLTNASRRIRNLTDRDLPLIHGEIGEIVHKDGTATAFARLVLSTGVGCQNR